MAECFLPVEAIIMACVHFKITLNVIPFRFRALRHRGMRLPSNTEFSELLSTTITPDGGYRFGKTTRYDLTAKSLWCHNLDWL